MRGTKFNVGDKVSWTLSPNAIVWKLEPQFGYVSHESVTDLSGVVIGAWETLPRYDVTWSNQFGSFTWAVMETELILMPSDENG